MHALPLKAPLPTQTARTGLAVAPLGALVFLIGMSAFACEVSLGEPLTAAFGGGVAYAAAFVLIGLLLGCSAGATIASRPATSPPRALLILGGALVTMAAMDLAIVAITGTAQGAPLAPILVLPAAMAGLVFAPIARFARRDHHGSRRLGALFAVALAGCATGAALAALLIVPWLGAAMGLRLSALVAASTGALSAGIAWRAPHGSLDTSPPSEVAASRSATRSPGGSPKLTLPTVAAALAFVAGSALVAMMHLVRVVAGDSQHTFGIALFTASVGLALGASRVRAVRVRHGRAAVSRSLAAAGLSIALTLPLWGGIPWLFAVAASSLTAHEQSLAHAGVLLVVITLPISWLGTSLASLLFPGHAGEPTSHGVARTSLAIATGAAIGAVLTGLFFLPLLGSQRALAVGALTLVLLSLALGDRAIAFTSAATIALVALAPGWDKRTLAFGIAPSGGTFAWSREDPVTGYAAITSSGVLAANGRIAVDPDALLDDRREVLIATLLAPRRERAELASQKLGMLDALAQHPWRAIDLRATSPALATAARLHLAPVTRTALTDPRVTRTYATRGAQDVVLVDAPRGYAPFAAREWMDAMRASLAEGGVGVIALPLSPSRAHDLTALAAAARARFPHVALAVLPTRALIVVTRGTLRVSPARLAEPALRGEGALALASIVALDGAVDFCTGTLDPASPVTAAALRACSSAETAHALLSP